MPNFTHGNTSKLLKQYGIEKDSICFEISERYEIPIKQEEKQAHVSSLVGEPNLSTCDLFLINNYFRNCFIKLQSQFGYNRKII
ncbi:hypothetical protein HUE87_06305 [Candidatus Sulfurimonas marisnigri]|uniref:Uncharacterized protein n=1 Tax=Candidatus Sulfurimonas marisnigri TaxID=2740405 RepID=A0A7S7LY09_9BACT|nr:hypothetical protein [Candidatus Sulfurimonas marisnigri]QOY53537.1 hypothetical protein HUE87_06305 [Candidatus Sulfurimonas marisnigri]